MTTEEHLKAMVGDLLVQIAVLRAQLDELKEQAPAAKPNGAAKESPYAERQADH